MVSTLARYTLVNSDLTANLRRTAREPIVAADTSYYRENIGSVHSVDDFVDDYRLFSYAMKAYGLEDMTYAKAFMKKVLTSDLSDKDSFANKLADPRYTDFAAAFRFSSDGTVSNGSFDGQTDAQEDDTIGLYSQKAQDGLTSVDTQTAYYRKTIGSVTSVDDLLGNSQLVTYALQANDIDPKYASLADVRKALTSDLSDPGSFANTAGGALLDIAKDYNFAADGTVKDGEPVQTDDQILSVTADYGFLQSAYTTPKMAADNTDNFTKGIASVHSVDDLMGDSQLLSYVLTAFGFGGYTSEPDAVREALTSDPDDPTSFANTTELEGNYAELAEFFDFDAEGNVPEGKSALSADNLDLVTKSYTNAYDDAFKAHTDTETAYYRKASANVTSVDDLMSDDRLTDYVLQAYGFDPETADLAKVKTALTDGGAKLGPGHDARYDALAAAFNFSPAGDAAPPDVAQSNANRKNTETAYATAAKKAGTDNGTIEAETRYYDDTIGTVTSLDAFLDDDRLVSYALKAGGIDPDSVDRDQLLKTLTSDFDDPDSYANATADRALREVAASFNFTADGEVGTGVTGTAQSRANTVRTSDLYVRETMEGEEGDDDTGVRLALYFERKAPEITSAYDILADSALLKVTQTALGLSSATGQADIDVQANYISDRLDIDGLQDPDTLSDFLSQFSAMYDLDNGTGSGTSSALTLITGSSASSGISGDLLLDIASLRSG
ncbi:DUF1217 domain-containing protein [Pararhizobium mangrovi]|uniref:DUF1217 domain-containing protein n=1 Tax=Pararhizobium mangrovi TaxID=2590452 RepID=A0A506TZP3_9HYPH|nr:DUF1217 domain-containing protein [Pararhizobium mangrovi]TPW25789.1 DUF1217 domain-containing protein [Pararhizobium mangrovi]